MDVQAVFDNFKNTITNHYFDMRGRTGRSQFGYYVLAYVVGVILASILGNILHLPLEELYNLALLLPFMGLGARRLQDIGRNGQLMWLMVILWGVTQIVGIITAMAFAFGDWLGFLFTPGLGVAGIASLVLGIVLIWFWCQPGDPGPNAFGPVPPVFDPSQRVSPTP